MNNIRYKRGYYVNGNPGTDSLTPTLLQLTQYSPKFKVVQLVLGRLIGSSLVESFTNSYTLTDPNGTEEKYT